MPLGSAAGEREGLPEEAPPPGCCRAAAG